MRIITKISVLFFLLPYTALANPWTKREKAALFKLEKNMSDLRSNVKYILELTNGSLAALETKINVQLANGRSFSPQQIEEVFHQDIFSTPAEIITSRSNSLKILITFQDSFSPDKVFSKQILYLQSIPKSLNDLLDNRLFGEENFYNLQKRIEACGEDTEKIIEILKPYVAKFESNQKALLEILKTINSLITSARALIRTFDQAALLKLEKNTGALRRDVRSILELTKGSLIALETKINVQLLTDGLSFSPDQITEVVDQDILSTPRARKIRSSRVNSLEILNTFKDSVSRDTDFSTQILALELIQKSLNDLLDNSLFGEENVYNLATRIEECGEDTKKIIEILQPYVAKFESNQNALLDILKTINSLITSTHALTKTFDPLNRQLTNHTR